MQIIFFKKVIDNFTGIWYNTIRYAGVMELADVLDSKSSGSDTVSVRPRSPAPEEAESKAYKSYWLSLFFYYPSSFFGAERIF